MRPSIATPCINICKLDPAEQLCLGCFRTLAELVGWSRLIAAEREAVMAELPARRQQHSRLIR